MRGFILGAACLMAFVGGAPHAFAAKSSYCHKWAMSLNARARSFNARCAHRNLSTPVYNRCKVTRDRVFAEQQQYHRRCGR